MYRDIDQLARAYFEDPTVENRKELVIGSTPLVRSIIARLNTPDRLLATFEDLQGVGLLGLMEAMDRYDPSHGVRFTSFAYRRIRGSVVDYLRMIDVLPRERREEYARAQQAIDTLGQENGDAPDDQEVAEFLGISLHEYHTILYDAQFRTSKSLHHRAEDDREPVLIDSLPHEDAEQVFDDLDRQSDRHYVDVLIRQLPDREQRIVHLYYDKNFTLKQIGGELGISEARVSQILSKLINGFRERLEETMRVAA